MSDQIELPGFLVLIFSAIVYGLWRLLDWFSGDTDEDKKKMPTIHGFGIDAQIRRRRLDLTRKDNTFRTSVGDKIERQRRGIFGSSKGRKRR